MNNSSHFQPKHYKESSKHAEWCKEMQSELDAMKENNT